MFSLKKINIINNINKKRKNFIYRKVWECKLMNLDINFCLLVVKKMKIILYVKLGMIWDERLFLYVGGNVD